MTGEVAAHVHLVRVARELLVVRHRDLVVERDEDDALDHEADEGDADMPLVALDGAQHKEGQNEEDGRVRHNGAGRRPWRAWCTARRGHCAVIMLRMLVDAVAFRLFFFR